MGSKARRADLQVLLLHNVDPSWEPAAVETVMAAAGILKDALLQKGHPVVDVPVTDSNLADLLAPFDPNDCIVFNWCEELPGMLHSESQVAEVLESLQFTYTGSPPAVLRRSWDKAAVKRMLDGQGIATPCWEVIPAGETSEWSAFPAIVKPAFEHCSNGITTDAVVMNPAELAQRIAFVHSEFQQPALVEDFIDGREFHVTMWGNGRVQMLPPAEMDFSAFSNLRDRLCTFDSKFIPGSRHYEKIELRIPAQLEATEHRRLGRAARRAYALLECRDYGRIDLRLRDGVFYVLDVNPNADLSPDTSLAYAAEAAGLTYGGLCSRLVGLAARRHPRHRRQLTAPPDPAQKDYAE